MLITGELSIVMITLLEVMQLFEEALVKVRTI